MRLPSRDSRTTAQRSPVAREMCSAMMASRASMSGTASLKASDAAAIAARRPESFGTPPLYSGVLGKEPPLSDQLSQRLLESRLSQARIQRDLVQRCPEHGELS